MFHIFSLLHSEPKHPHIITDYIVNFQSAFGFIITQVHILTSLWKWYERFEMIYIYILFRYQLCCTEYHNMTYPEKTNGPKASIACNSTSFRGFLCAAEGLACQYITQGLWKLGQNEAKDLKVENVYLCLLKHVRLWDWLNCTGCLTWSKERLYFETFR